MAADRPGRSPGVPEPADASVRQQILQRLRAGPCTLRDLARDLGLREADAAEHLGHARRSLSPGERLRESPAACRCCGFEFRKRDRPGRPGRCPRCRGERIRPAELWVEGPDGDPP